MNNHEYPFLAAQDSRNLIQGARRGSYDLLAPPTAPSQSTRPDLGIQTEELQPRLACPYYKRSPNQKHKRASCIHPGFANIARLKEHLYRRHQIFRCGRCNRCFATETKLDEHVKAQISCQDHGYQRDYNDGFDQKQKERLRARSRRSETNTEEDKWRGIFTMLFPDDEAIPTPYCHDTPSPELDNYHQYCRDHTDRVLQHRLGSIPNEKLKSIVRDVQEQLFGEFHALQSDDDRSSCTSRASTPLSSASPGTPLHFEEDPAAESGIQNPEPLFAEVVQGEVMLPNPQHVFFQYRDVQTPQIILSEPQSCETFTQANSIAYVNIPGVSHLAPNHGSDDVGSATNFAPFTNHFQSDVWMVDSQPGDWPDPSASGPSAFGT